MTFTSSAFNIGANELRPCVIDETKIIYASNKRPFHGNDRDGPRGFHCEKKYNGPQQTRVRISSTHYTYCGITN